MKILAVGDPHVEESNFDDSVRLFNFVTETAHKEKVDQIHFLGDMYHDHGISKAVVQELIHQQLAQLRQLAPVFLTNGNHDSTSDMQHSCITVHSSLDNVTAVLKPTMATAFLGVLPYYKHSADFLAAVDSLKDSNPDLKVVFCHQDWQGAEYENGFFAPGGTNPKEIEARGLLAYSGHIHKGSKLGQAVRLIGAPRWLTKSDADQSRGIWILDFDASGQLKNEKYIASDPFCAVSRTLDLKTGFTQLPTFKPIDKVWIQGTDLTEDEVATLKTTYNRPVIRHERTKSDLTPSIVSETLGINDSIKALTASYFTQNPSVDKKSIMSELSLRLGYPL